MVALDPESRERKIAHQFNSINSREWTELEVALPVYMHTYRQTNIVAGRFGDIDSMPCDIVSAAIHRVSERYR